MSDLEHTVMNHKRPIGAPSQIIQGRGRGGKVLVRLGKERHLAFARLCQHNNTSMNEILINCIDKMLETNKIST